MVHAHMLEASPGRQKPRHNPSRSMMAREKEPSVLCTVSRGSTCQRCFRQSRGFVMPITRAPVKHDAPISAPRGDIASTSGERTTRNLPVKQDSPEHTQSGIYRHGHRALPEEHAARAQSRLDPRSSLASRSPRSATPCLFRECVNNTVNSTPPTPTQNTTGTTQ